MLAGAAALAALLALDTPLVRGGDALVPRADAVRRVSAALGLTVRGAEHLTGAVDGRIDPPSHRVLSRLLAGYSFALVLEADGSGQLVVVRPAHAASRVVGTEPGPPAPLWGFGDVATLARTIGDDDMRRLVQASSDADSDARLTAVATLADHGAAALDALAAATRDPDPVVRFTAMQHLAAAGASAAPHLVAAFHDGADAEIRALALSALFASDPAVAKPLIAVALGDPDPTVRRTAEALAAE